MKKIITKKQSSGFTLIEIMATFAILGVIGAVAVPMYTNNQIKGQVSEAFSLATDFKNAVSSHYSINGKDPAKYEDLHLSVNKGKFIEGSLLLPTKKTVVIVMGYDDEVNKNIRGQEIYLNYYNSTNAKNVKADNLTWECFSTMPQKYLPSSCVGGLEFLSDEDIADIVTPEAPVEVPVVEVPVVNNDIIEDVQVPDEVLNDDQYNNSLYDDYYKDLWEWFNKNKQKPQPRR